MTIFTIVLLIIAGILSALTTICIQLYLTNYKIEWLLGSVLSSVVIIIFYYLLFINSDNVAILYTSCKIISILIVLYFSVQYMEEFITFKQWIGVGFALVAILLLT